MSTKKPMIHRAAPDKPTPLHERLSSLEAALRDLLENKLGGLIAAGALATGKKIYDELAAEHGRVFEAQEQAFSAILELFDRRLRALEDYTFTDSPTSYRVRDVLDAIGSYHADVATKGLRPWHELDQREQWNEIGARVRDRFLQEVDNATKDAPGAIQPL